MKYQLFIGEDCHQCQEVIDEIKEQEIEVDIINIDQSQERPPINVFAYPVLFQGQVLLRYGSDIITYLKANR